MKVVIIGGVAGGATAAARLRRLDEQAEIVVFERSGYVSYANCGLPYYIGGVIEAPEALTLQTPESFFARFQVDMRVRHEVTAIHPDKKTVSVKNLGTGESFEESYDKLILSPGAKPTRPPLPGLELEQLFTLRTVEDTFRLKAHIDASRPKSAVLVGGGFIGVELAENLRELGLEVTIVEQLSQLMGPFDPDMASFLHGEVRRHGIRLALGRTVEGFVARDGGVDVLLKDAPPLHADMVALAIGVTPDTALAKKADAKAPASPSLPLLLTRPPNRRQNILEHQEGIQLTIAILAPQLLQKALQALGIGRGVHLTLIPCQNGILLAPGLGPVHLLRHRLTGALDGLLDLLHVHIEGDQLVQGQPIEHRQALGLPDIRQSLIPLPLGDGLAAHPQLLRHRLLTEPPLFSGLKQALS